VLKKRTKSFCFQRNGESAIYKNKEQLSIQNSRNL